MSKGIMAPTAYQEGKMGRYEIINHGWEYADYFPGCGVAFTDYTRCVIGSGSSSKDAYEQAVEVIYADEGDKADQLKLPRRPAGFRLRDKVPARAEDAYWYVSIRYRLED